MKKIIMKKFFLVLFITLFYVLSNITTSFGVSTTLASKDFRNMYKINQVDPSKVSTWYKAKRDINGEKWTPQGFCIAKGYFVYILYNNNSKNKNYKKTYLRFISIAEKKCKMQIYLGKYGHINDITYNSTTKKVIIPVDNSKKYLFVDVSSSDPKKFKKIDKLTINNGVPSYGIAYCSNEKNYIIANIYNIYYTKKQSLSTVEKDGKHQIGNIGTMSGLGRQGIACHGGSWYYTKWTEKDKKYTYKNSVFNAYKNSNFIVEYDYKSCKVKQNIYIPRAVITGEIEGVDFYNNQMYGLFIKGNDLVILKIDYSTGFKGNNYYYAKTEANHFKGQKATGWATINGNSYYFGPDGKVKKWNTINGFKYYFGENGIMRTGFQTINNKVYYFNKGIEKEKNSYKGTMATGWKIINKNKYYFGTNGVMRTGFQTINKKVYYFNKGIMVKGWNTINKKKYYFGEDGVMRTSFQTINNKKYYFKNGIMATGWNTINGFKYYFGDNGVMRTGFQTINNKYYYFYESSDGKKHYNGTLASKGWLNIDGRTFYIGSNGEVYTGDREINGRVYVFSKENKNGLLKGEMYLMQVE